MDFEDKGGFTPPLWRQRRLFILDELRKHRIQTVLDYGCGEASLLAFLIPFHYEEVPFTKLAGLDISNAALKEAIQRCQPWESDYHQLREEPLIIDIFKGSVDEIDARLAGYEAIVCAEVVEHLEKNVLCSFFDVVLGAYAPKLLIITTPNAEYNTLFPSLNYGKPNAIYRHDDHKFEWTRAEFTEWCTRGAAKYGYTTEISGIGLLDNKKDILSYGYCTQACIFIRNDDLLHPRSQPILIDKPHVHAQHIEFPYYQPSSMSQEGILREVEGFIAALCRAETFAMLEQCQLLKDDVPELEWYTDWDTADVSSTAQVGMRSIDTSTTSRIIWTLTPVCFPLSFLWDIHRVRQLCKTQESLTNLLSHHQEDYQIHSQELTVNKAFKLLTERTGEISCDVKDNL